MKSSRLIKPGRRELLTAAAGAGIALPGVLGSREASAALQSSLTVLGSIPASACGMFASNADNSLQLAAGLTNFQGVIDGGGQTFKFTQAGGTDSSPGPLFLAGLKGVIGLRDMTLDFSACLADQFCLFLSGIEPISPLLLTINASANNQSVFLSPIDAATLRPGQYIVVNSQATWCTSPQGNTITTNEYNRVRFVNSGTGEITLQNRLLNTYNTSDGAVIIALYPDAASLTGMSPLKIIMDNVTIIGAGSARTASLQYGLRIRNTLGSQINATFRNCYDFAFEESMWCIDTYIPYLKASNSNVPGRGYGCAISGSWRNTCGTLIGEDCDQTVSRGSASTTIAGVVFGLVCRDHHCNVAISSGNFHSGACVNSHPGVANSWVDVAMGTSAIDSSDGFFITLNGYQEGIGAVNAGTTLGHAVLLQYCGGRDDSNYATYIIGPVNVGRCGDSTNGSGNILLVQGFSTSSSAPLDYVDIGGIVCGNTQRGIGIVSDSGPVGTVNIGPSNIVVSGTVSGSGLAITGASFSIGDIYLRDSSLTTEGTTSAVRAVNLSTSGPTTNVYLTNVSLSGGDNGIEATNGIVHLLGHCTINGFGIAEYGIASTGFINILGDAPAEQWAPTGGSSFPIRCSKFEIAPLAGGFAQTVIFPAGSFKGQEIAVNMLANGDASMTWTPAGGETINGASSPMAAYSVQKYRFDGISAWNRIG